MTRPDVRHVAVVPGEVVRVRHQPLGQQVGPHLGPRIRRQALHDREVESEPAGVAERPRDRPAVVVRIADDEAADGLDPVLLEKPDGTRRLVLVLSALGRDVERRDVHRLGVLDAHEDGVEAGARHRRRERRVLGDAVDGGLHDVPQVAEARALDLLAQLLEPRHVDRDVVVDEEHAADAAPVEGAQVRDHTPDREAAERPPVHPPDRAERAGQRAAAARLGDVEGAVEVERPVPCARLPARERHGVELEKRPVRVVPVARPAPPREARDRPEVERRAREPVDELAKRDLALAPHDEVEELGVTRAHLVGDDGRMVAAEDVQRPRCDPVHRRRQRPRRRVLERHGGVADEVGGEGGDLLEHAVAHASRLHDEIEDADVVAGYLRRDRAEAEVRELHHPVERRGRVGHRHQQDPHAPSYGRAVRSASILSSCTPPSRSTASSSATAAG